MQKKNIKEKEQKRGNKKLRNEQGITLIALVITIIVLLILAGVSIAMLIGDNGILTQANNAKIETEKAKVKEQRDLTKVEASSYLEKHEYTDVNGEKVIIPAGFAVSQVDGENIVEDGLVIIDSNGNEFVWVPFTGKEEDFKRYSGFSNGNIQGDVGNCSEPFLNGYETEEEEYNKMKQSVLENDGFYVARYEAGKEDGRVVSKEGATVWTNITWGVSSTNIGTEGAVYQSQQMYKDAYGITSTLIYGTQWDAIMSWIDPSYKTGTCDTNKSFVANSTNKGNYSGGIKVSGSNNEYKVKNIYDLAGNVYEWTMEADNNSYRIARGGGGNSSTGVGSPASSRYHLYPGNNGNGTGFRVCLYLK